MSTHRFHTKCDICGSAKQPNPPTQPSPELHTEKRITMKVGLVNYRVNPEMSEHVHIHRAAKQHICHGGHNGERHTHCCDAIVKGSVYVEYTGESIPFQSGKRYHPACAAQQGLVHPL